MNPPSNEMALKSAAFLSTQLFAVRTTAAVIRTITSDRVQMRAIPFDEFFKADSQFLREGTKKISNLR